MVAIDNLLSCLDERAIAQQVGIGHDEARMRYPLHSNTVGSYAQFSDLITDYYNFHYTSCVSRGGQLPTSEAYGRAKELLEREYQRDHGDIVSAFNDAQDGTNGGMRVVLDKIAEGLKAEVIERHITNLFDRYVRPNSWEEQVSIVRQFIRVCGPMLNSSVRSHQPEAYARDYKQLIQSYVEGLRRTSSLFRRL